MWRFSPEDGYAPGMYLGAVTKDSVYAGSPGGWLHSIDMSNGRSRWSLPVKESHQTTVYQPIVDRGIVLAGFTVFDRPTKGGVVAVEARTGIERWRAHFSEQPAGAGDAKHRVGGRAGDMESSGRRRGFDRFDLRVSIGATDRWCTRWRVLRWRTSLRTFYQWSLSGTAWSSGSLTGLVVAYRLPSFRERWRYSPSEAGSVLFGMTADRNSVLVPLRWWPRRRARPGQRARAMDDAA